MQTVSLEFFAREHCKLTRSEGRYNRELLMGKRVKSSEQMSAQCR